MSIRKIILKDNHREVSTEIDIHLLSGIPFFSAILSNNYRGTDNKEIMMEVDDAIITRNVIESYIETSELEKNISTDIAKNYLGIIPDLDYLDDNIDENQFELLIKLYRHMGYHPDLNCAIIDNLPKDYDLSGLPNDNTLLQLVRKTYHYRYYFLAIGTGSCILVDCNGKIIKETKKLMDCCAIYSVTPDFDKILMLDHKQLSVVSFDSHKLLYQTEATYGTDGSSIHCVSNNIFYIQCFVSGIYHIYFYDIDNQKKMFHIESWNKIVVSPSKKYMLYCSEHDAHIVDLTNFDQRKIALRNIMVEEDISFLNDDTIFCYIYDGSASTCLFDLNKNENLLCFNFHDRIRTWSLDGKYYCGISVYEWGKFYIKIRDTKNFGLVFQDVLPEVDSIHYIKHFVADDANVYVVTCRTIITLNFNTMKFKTKHEYLYDSSPILHTGDRFDNVDNLSSLHQ